MASESDLLIQVYRDTVSELYRFVILRCGGSRELAEDVVQETYLRAMAKWAGGRLPKNPPAWLQTVSRNLLIKHYRRKRPSPIDSARLEALVHPEPPANPGPDHVSLLYWGLAQVGPRSGRLLEAFHIEGQSVQTIAREWGLTERAVEGRLRRARQALKRRLLPRIKTNGALP